MNDITRDEVIEILSRHELCVLSTVNKDSRPESAIVAFSHSDNLELLVGTSNQTRKFFNLLSNPNVAVVIGDRQAEVQYEGTARQLEESEIEERLNDHFAKLPGADIYRKDPSQVYLLITPTWLRLTIHEKPNRIEEMRFA